MQGEGKERKRMTSVSVRSQRRGHQEKKGGKSPAGAQPTPFCPAPTQAPPPRAGPHVTFLPSASCTSFCSTPISCFSSPENLASLWIAYSPPHPLSSSCWMSLLERPLPQFQDPAPPLVGKELPLGAMAGITRDILGREVLLWLMAGSSRWS